MRIIERERELLKWVISKSKLLVISVTKLVGLESIDWWVGKDWLVGRKGLAGGSKSIYITGDRKLKKSSRQRHSVILTER